MWPLFIIINNNTKLSAFIYILLVYGDILWCLWYLYRFNNLKIKAGFKIVICDCNKNIFSLICKCNVARGVDNNEYASQ